MIFLGKEKTTYMEGFVTSHKVVLSSFSSACFQMAELCWTSHKDGQHLYVFKRASGEGLQGAHSKCHQLFAKLFLQ